MAHKHDTVGKNHIKLFKNEERRGGPWPSDIHRYYDKLDDERGIPRPKKLIQGYKQAPHKPSKAD